jgi:hypothetical protein
MAEPTTSRRATPLLDVLLTLIADARPTRIQERTWLRLQLVTLGSLVALGRHTLSQVLVALGLGDADWTAWYRLFNRGRIAFGPGQRQVLRQLLAGLAPGTPLPLVVDATQLPRSSRHFPGVGATRAPRCPIWRPGVHLAQRVELVSGLLPRTASGDSRAVPIRSTVLRTERTQPFGDAPVQTEGAAACALLASVRIDLAVLGAPDQPLLVLADGAYSTAPVVRALPAQTWLLARCAKNRALFALPGPEPRRRGRQRVYGDRGPTPQQTLTRPGRWTSVRFAVRGRTLAPRVRVTGPWRVQGAPAHPVFLLVVKGIDRGQGTTRRQREPQCFLVSAQAVGAGWQLPRPVAELLAWAWQRWEVEVMHRELKSSCGFGDQQAWSATGAPATLEWALWTYALLILTGSQVWGLGPAPGSALGRWWRPRRWSVGRVLQGVRAELWQTGDLRPDWSRSPDAWGAMETWMATQTSAALGMRHV